MCLIAPAIQGNPPPAPVVAALRYLVAPLIPKRQIPDALESGEDFLAIFVVIHGGIGNVGLGVSASELVVVPGVGVVVVVVVLVWCC